jgi:hypothetical protein
MKPSFTRIIHCASRTDQESSSASVGPQTTRDDLCFISFSGILENGEARLLFSSAQVEYIRYWLHAMGLTKELIPLPYSDCLLTSSRLQNISPVVYKTGSQLHLALKVFYLIRIYVRLTGPTNPPTDD